MVTRPEGPNENNPISLAGISGDEVGALQLSTSGNAAGRQPAFALPMRPCEVHGPSPKCPSHAAKTATRDNGGLGKAFRVTLYRGGTRIARPEVEDFLPTCGRV